MIAAGETIGNYRVLKKIGTGGMGAVYLAEHPLIGRKVALKVIHRELAGNRDVVQRFFQEARAVNKIGSPHIVEIHDFGQTGEGDHFYMMEYLEGQTLAGLLSREHVVDVMRALHVGAQIADALAAAHGAGVIHRDLKPDNVMLVARHSDPDFVKLLDFGLAKMFAAQSTVKTAAGVLLGTPQYMSPEACESKVPVDHRTDIYALGVLLFQMMTGQLPFDGESMGAVLLKQVMELPPVPRGLNPAIPPSVEQIVLRCLAKPVDARFPTMASLREALLDPEAYLRGSPPVQSARPVAPGEARVDARTLVAYALPETRVGLPLPPVPSFAGTVDQRQTVVAMPPPPGIAAPKQDTMQIGTPLGHRSSPRRVWPIVVAGGLTLGLGAGAIAVWLGRGAATPETSTASDAAVVVMALDRKHVHSGDVPYYAPPAVDAPPPPDAPLEIDAATSAMVAFDSVPDGAEVLGPDRKRLGKTPLKLAWPIGTAPVHFELKFPGYKRKVEELVVGQNTAIHVELEKLTVVARPHPQGSGAGSSRPGTGTELMRPGD